MTESAPKPWEQQSDESGKAFAAFQVYRDLPPEARTFDLAYKTYKARVKRVKPEAVGSPDGRYRSWAKCFNWKTRAEAWDRERDRERQQQVKASEAQALEEMRKRHIGLGISLQTAGANAMVKKLEKGATEIPVSAIPRFISEGIKLERISRGEPDSIVGGDPIGRLAELLGVHPSELRDQARKQ